MRTFVVFTATYNRANRLDLLYDSLKKLNYKDFYWLVIDDGSSDNTQEVVNRYIDEGILEIIYHRFPVNGGKHQVLRYAFSHLNAKYALQIDDDDQLTQDCLDVFLQEWKRIDEEGITDIGEIRALVSDQNGCIVGKKRYIPNISFDSDYIKMNWVLDSRMENLSCYKSEIFCDCNLFEGIDSMWLFDKVHMVYEDVFWNRFARKYRTRYIPNVLRIYNRGTSGSLTATSINRTKCYNYVFTNSVVLNELGKDKYCNIRRLLKSLAQYWACALALKLPIKKCFTSLEGLGVRLISLFVIPIAWIVGLYFVKYKF